jgi:hypothetical protein
MSEGKLGSRSNGKHLDLTGDKDPSKHYFKNEFAVHVVKKGAATVNFGGFDPLLTALVAVKLDYAKRLAAMASSAPTPALPLAKTASKP